MTTADAESEIHADEKAATWAQFTIRTSECVQTQGIPAIICIITDNY